MTSEAPTIDGSLDDLLNRHFPGKVVRKDLTKLVKEGANVPVYVLEYLLGSYCASNDEVVIAEGLQTVKRILAENYVRPDEAEKVKSTIREKGSLKIIDRRAERDSGGVHFGSIRRPGSRPHGLSMRDGREIVMPRACRARALAPHRCR